MSTGPAAAPTPESGAAAAAAERPNLVLAVLLLAVITASLAQTLVLPAIPSLQAEFDASAATTSWVLTGFLLSASVTTPIVGKLGDILGKGRVLTAVMVLFGVGAAVAALATSIEMLIAGRVLQGIGAGVFPLAFGVIRDSLPRERVPGAISLVSSIFGVGAGIGLPLSGVLVDNFDVAWLFWLGLVALPVAVAAARWIPASPTTTRGSVDWAGALLLAAGLATLLLGVTQASTLGWGSPAQLALLAGGAAVLAVWVLLEQRVREPLIRLDVLTQRTVLMTNTTGFIVGLGMFAGFLLIPQLAQAPTSTGYGFGQSATVAGLVLLPSAVGQLLVGLVAGRVGVAVGFRATLVLGAATVAASFVLLALVHSAVWHLLLGGLLLGAGIAFAYGSMANIVVAAVQRSEVGVATAINTVVRSVGGSFGSAIATALVVGSAGAGGVPAGSGYTTAFIVAAAAALLATGAALLVPRAGQGPRAVEPVPAKPATSGAAA